MELTLYDPYYTLKRNPMLIKEVMNKNVITVTPSSNLIDMIKLFHTYHFHIFPVVDKDNHILGIVNIESLMTFFKPHSKHLTRMLRSNPSLKVEQEEYDILDTEITTEWARLTLVADIMETNFVTIEEDRSISEARALMKMHNIQGLLVVKDERLVGVITLFDMIYTLFQEKGLME